MSKSLLNTYCQKSHIGYPSYCHHRLGDLFVCEVVVDQEEFKSMECCVTKKMAEEDAAGVALQNFVQLHPIAQNVQDLLECVEKQYKKDVNKLTFPVPTGNSLSYTQQELPPQPSPMGPAPVLSQWPSVLNLSPVCMPPVTSKSAKLLPSPHERSAELFCTPSSFSHSKIPPQETLTSIPVPSHHYASVSSPTSLPLGLWNPNHSSSRSRTSPSKRKDTTSKNAPSSNSFIKDLDTHCQIYNLSAPVYSITEKRKRFTAEVVVDGTNYRGTRDHETFEQAKEYATLVALASIGMQALRVRGPAQDPAQDPLLDQSQTPQQFTDLRRTSSSSYNSQKSSSISANFPGQFSGASIATVPFESSPQVPHPPAYFKSCVSSAGLKEIVSLASGRASLGDKLNELNIPRNSAPVANLSSMSNYKTALNTFCQRNRVPSPIYDCIYPEDEVGYIVNIKVNGREFKSTPHGTKRGAESMAAAMALKSMGLDIEIPENGDVNNGFTCGGPESLLAPPEIPDAERNISYKNLLQEYLQKSQCSSLPSYDTQRTENGYESTVSVRTPPDFKSLTFRGKPHANKRAAEQECAKHACMELRIVMS